MTNIEILKLMGLNPLTEHNENKDKYAVYFGDSNVTFNEDSSINDIVSEIMNTCYFSGIINTAYEIIPDRHEADDFTSNKDFPSVFGKNVFDRYLTK